MAPRLSHKTPTQEARVISKQAFDKLLRRLKTGENEMASSKEGIKTAVDKATAEYNLHPDALRVVRKYLKKEPAQAAEFMLQLSIYWEYAALGQPNNDLLETPAQRKARHKTMTKPQIEAEKRELGKPTHHIKGGALEPLPEAAE